jgi:hypothetical protein
MKKTWLLVGVALVLCMTNPAISAVNAYDTFGYEPGEIVGESAPALGFTGAWGGGGGNLNQCTVQAASLAYTGADSALQDASGMFQVIVPNFDGGRAGRFLDTDPNGPFAGYINTQGTIGKAGQTLYISFLMRTSHTTPFYAIELKNADLGDNGSRLYLGNDMGGSDLQICAYRNRDTSPANMGKEFQWLGAATTNPELFVIRIDFGTTGDNVTVYRDPSLDAEPVMAPHLVNSRFLDFNGITMAAWVGPGGRVAQFDEICIASTYADAVRFYNFAKRAQTPTPADGAVDITGAPGVTLSWTAGTGVTPTGYKVYFSTVLDEVLTEDAAAYQGTTTSTSLAIGSINTDSMYYWSVTETAEPNDIPGVVWMFETNKTFPIVVSQPVSQQVFANENVSFTFTVNSVSDVFYQWFDANGQLTDSGNISGTQTATLVITGAQVSNEGNYYCQATNNAGMITSNTVRLMISRLVGYWNLNQPAGSDPNVAWQDLSGSANDLQPVLTVPASFTWTAGADGTPNGSLVFDGQFALGTKKLDGTMNDIPVGNESYTILVWFKTTPKIQGVIGWGNYGSYNQCNAIAMYPENQVMIKNYWWDNDMDISRGYSLVDNAWHQVIVTYTGTTRVGYIDGIQAATNNPAPHNVPNSTHFLIGKANDTNPTYELFAGAIDEVKVYNYALTKNEVALSYTDFVGGNLCVYPPAYDLTNDCRVDLDDFAVLAGQWLNCGLFPDCMN